MPPHAALVYGCRTGGLGKVAVLAVDCALNIHYILWISVAEQVSATSATARLAQSVERKALNLVVVGLSPTVGDFCCEYIVWVLKLHFINLRSATMI